MPPTEPTIANYDAQSADEITQRLRTLSQADLTKLERYERQGQARTTVLERIAALRGEPPWPGYDEMEVEEVNDRLKQRDADAARQVLDYERRHKVRTTIVEFAERRRDEGDAQPPTARSSSPQTRSQPKRNARKSATAKPASRSTARRSSAAARSSGQRSSSGSRSTKAGQRPSSGSRSTRSTSSTRAKSASRPVARSSSGSRRGSSSQTRSGAQSRSAGASRSRTQARSSSRSRPKAPRGVKQRITGAVRSTGARTEQAAKGTGHAVAAAARSSRDAVGGAAQDTGKAVGTAAKKAKVPALATGAFAAALGGGLVLGSKLMPKRRLSRGRISQAGKSIDKVRKGIVDAGDRVDTIGKQVSAVNDEIQKIAGGAVRD